jgi:SagB-type dehydrogenase family enzyme
VDTDGRAALAYHEATKHSPDSVRRDTHRLDWDNQPRPYKLYTDLEAFPLPREFLSSEAPALSAIGAPGVDRNQSRDLDLATLTTVLHYSAGITKHLRYPGGLMAFRAAACTGALYHIELYVVCGDLPDLAAGVYQFGVHDFALRQLRPGDFRSTLIEASGGEPAVANAPATIVCTSTFWRNSWKYQARAYRHAFWDNGTILANMLAVARAHELPARVVVGFADEQVNRLIGVDGEDEAAISLVPLGYAPDLRPPSVPPVNAISPPTVPLSAREVDYPAIREMHARSSLDTGQGVAAWRASALAPGFLAEPGDATEDRVALKPIPEESLPSDAIERVIQRRGSSRRFERSAIGYDALSIILAQATRGIPADFIAPGAALADPYLIVNAVDGLESGAYFYDRPRGGLQRLQAGDFRDVASYLALTQPIAGDAAVNVYFLADLSSILDRLGNRGYRAAQLDASVTAGRMYLAAYALGLGATGLTFFDDDVTTFFSPHAQGKSVMFLIALGNPARRGPI